MAMNLSPTSWEPLLRAARGSGLWWVCRECVVGTEANQEWSGGDQSPCPHSGGGSMGPHPG